MKPCCLFALFFLAGKLVKGGQKILSTDRGFRFKSSLENGRCRKAPRGTMQGKSKNINSVEILSRTLYKLKALFLRTNQLHNVHTPNRSPSASVPTIPSRITACDNATNATPLHRQLHVHSIEFFGFVGIEWRLIILYPLNCKSWNSHLVPNSLLQNKKLPLLVTPLRNNVNRRINACITNTWFQNRFFLLSNFLPFGIITAQKLFVSQVRITAAPRTLNLKISDSKILFFPMQKLSLKKVHRFCCKHYFLRFS